MYRRNASKALETIKNAVRHVPGSLWIASRARSFAGKRAPAPQGVGGVEVLGHRVYVGGNWERIGRLQFEFLVSCGLLPHHYLLDIACGSLRAGIHFIPYLESGHYLGIDKEATLIDAGINDELGMEAYRQKRPELVVSDTFEFETFTVRPHFALAQSLFTHLPPSLIHGCLDRLHGFLRSDGVFYATFKEVGREVVNPDQPHDHDAFEYTRRQMEDFGTDNGWNAEYIGEWNHPRHQKMMLYRPR
jgi:hypothetical protein